MGKNFVQANQIMNATTGKAAVSKPDPHNFSNTFSDTTKQAISAINATLSALNVNFSTITLEDKKDVEKLISTLNADHITPDLVRYFVEQQGENALKSAISICYHRTYYKISLHKTYSKNKDEKGVRAILKQEYILRQVDGLLPFVAIFDGMTKAGYNLPDTWKADVRTFACSFAAHVAASIGAEVSISENVDTEIYTSILYKSASAPMSKSAMTKRLQRVLDTLFFVPSEKNVAKNAFMIRSKDLNFLTHSLVSKRRNALALNILDVNDTQNVMFEILHAIVTGAVYEIDYVADPKTK